MHSPRSSRIIATWSRSTMPITTFVVCIRLCALRPRWKRVSVTTFGGRRNWFSVLLFLSYFPELESLGTFNFLSYLLCFDVGPHRGYSLGARHGKELQRMNPIMVNTKPIVTKMGRSMLTTAAGRACSHSGHLSIPICHPPVVVATMSARPLTHRALPSFVVMSLKSDKLLEIQNSPLPSLFFLCEQL